MPERRDIDKRDIDRLLAALTDIQIASLYGMSEIEVYHLRQSRRALQLNSLREEKSTDK